ncbi:MULTISPECIES: GNAT family N-acetyltransferase [unclassified Rothia (in: high G+C Gram-positive bacteria)]|uniref:GNAT family N-acetyltransferase n=1 Tax=unclassified Rothia (in: high G+C Gram-positive bacteria) TaxID=2689056 RepID=UPI0008A4EEAE|nr:MULTISPECIES: histone acetyltransferase [unclassified Rothia (in: high G+C Gram-positive bacteria)]OFM24739.1 histone acetyltransferase [Rothia sp. HMSC069D01]OFN71228.1 histone acetyltransferase [Rothia sp. HMSC078H08]
MTDTQGTESARGAKAIRGAVNRGAVNRGVVNRGAVTTVDRARHILHTQLEADFCQAPGSISRALEELRDYPEAESLPLLATVQPPSEKMGAARRRNDDIWELRVANYASVGILCAKHPRVLDKAIDYMLGDQSNWLGDYAQLRQLNELLTPYTQQVSGTSIYYTPGRALLNSVVPEGVQAQEVKCAVPGMGMMRRVDPAELKAALLAEITGERTIRREANASAGALEVDPQDTQARVTHLRVELLDAEQIERFRGDKRYSNALGFSVTRPDVLVLAAYPVEEDAADVPAAGESAALADPIALVGVSDDSPIMRQIGIDVLPAWRGAGIASVLVRDAARLTLAEGYLPFYGTSPSHILSQRVAMNAGLVPTWWEYVSTSLNDLPMD